MNNISEIELDVVEESESNQNSLNSTQNSAMSKQALKKLAKKERWAEKKVLRRLKEKEKNKAKKRDISRKVLKKRKMITSNCKASIAIDLSFDHLMNEKDLGKCIKQIHRCYSINRRFEDPIQFHVCGFEGDSKNMMEKHNGFTNWDIHFHESSFLDVFEKSKIVYLTSESENEIDVIDEKSIYMIGGLVDHNSQKGLCHRIALENGLNHARLPIDKFLDMKTKKVLTIDHVFEIVSLRAQGKSWEEVLTKVIPDRMNAVLKSPPVSTELEILSEIQST